MIQGSATTYNAGGITHVTSANYIAHAAQFAHIGAARKAGTFPELSKHGETTMSKKRYMQTYMDTNGLEML